MSKSNAHALVLATLILAAAACHVKPNAIFILADNLGYGDVGWAWQEKRRVGEARIYTPNLDRLAHEGVIFSSCAPSIIEMAHGFNGWKPDFKEFAKRKHNLVCSDQRMKRTGDIVELQAGGKDKPWRKYDVVKDPHQDHELNAAK